MENEILKLLRDNYIANFNHIIEVCKKGNCCRYLGNGSNGHRCEKFSPLKTYINGRVKNQQIDSTGDNCGGILGEISEKKHLFIEKKASISETAMDVGIIGVIKEIEVKNKHFVFNIKDNYGDIHSFSGEIDYLLIFSVGTIIYLNILNMKDLIPAGFLKIFI